MLPGIVAAGSVLSAAAEAVVAPTSISDMDFSYIRFEVPYSSFKCEYTVDENLFLDASTLKQTNG